jgi:structural maintenance of chromosome 4
MFATPAVTLSPACYHATCIATRQAADAARQQLDKSAAAEKALEQKLRGLRTTAAGLKADSSSSANQSVVVQALLEAKRKGEIPGVYGRLGDLGSIDSK